MAGRGEQSEGRSYRAVRLACPRGLSRRERRPGSGPHSGVQMGFFEFRRIDVADDVGYAGRFMDRHF